MSRNNLARAAINYLGSRGYETRIQWQAPLAAYTITCKKDGLWYTHVTTDITRAFIQAFEREIHRAFEQRGRSLQRRFAEPNRIVQGTNMTATEITQRRGYLGSGDNFGQDGPGISQWMRIKDDWTDLGDFRQRCHKYGFPTKIPGLTLNQKWKDKVFNLNDV